MKPIALILIVLSALTAPAAQRDFAEKWNVATGPAKKMPLKWFQAETIQFDLASSQNGSDFDLTDSMVVWEIVGWKDYTNVYSAVTGTVTSATSGESSFTLTPEQSNIAPGTYRGFARALQTEGSTIINQTVLAWQTIKIEWSPDSRYYSLVGPLSYPTAYDTATVNAIEASLSNQIDTLTADLTTASNTLAAAIASAEPGNYAAVSNAAASAYAWGDHSTAGYLTSYIDTNTQLTEPQVDDYVADNGYAQTTDLTTASNTLATATAELATATVLRTDLDGGWYYPDWFAWSFTQIADGIPDLTTIATNNDVVVDRHVYSSAAGCWDVSVAGVRSADFVELDLASSDPSVATCTATRVSYVSTGTVTVTGTLGDYTRTAELDMELISAITTDTVTGCVTGSAVCVCATGIDSRLSDGSDTAVYTQQDHDAAQYTRNPDSWVADLDLTCVSPWNSYGGRTRAGTLIGSDCIIFANHYPIATGSTIRFVTSDNRVIDRTLTARAQVGSTDFHLGKLASAISTNDCRPALLLPANESDYMPYSDGYGELRPGLMIDQYEHAYVGNLPYITTASRWTASTNATRTLYWKLPVTGDSGSPMLLITGTGPPIVPGTFHANIGGPSTARYNADIRTTAAALGCDTNSITDADLSAYINFNPVPLIP